MSSYWVMDTKGLVIGPLTLQALKDIAAQTRMGPSTRASADGKTWSPLSDIPELAHAILGQSVEERRRREIQESQRIRMQLDRYRELKTYELFSTVPGSSAKDHRPGYLALARPYHPGRLPKDAAPELIRASIDMFQFLATRMAELENTEKAAPAAGAKKPAPQLKQVAPAAAPPPSTPAVELRRPPGKSPELHFRLDASTVGLFCDHKIINIASTGFFIPTSDLIPMGTVVQVHVTGKDKKLQARGVVVLESTATGPMQKMGFGVRMEKLAAEDVTWLKEQVNALRTKR